jgi:hypothetical protein
MLKKIILTGLIFGFSINLSNAATPINFANIEPIRYNKEDIVSTFLRGYKAAKEPGIMEQERIKRDLDLEVIRLENALKQLELQHALEQYKYETTVKKSGSKNLRQRQNNENLYLTKAVKPKTVRVRSYYRKNGTYVKPHYRSRTTRRK